MNFYLVGDHFGQKYVYPISRTGYFGELSYFVTPAPPIFRPRRRRTVLWKEVKVINRKNGDEVQAISLLVANLARLVICGDAATAFACFAEREGLTMPRPMYCRHAGDIDIITDKQTDIYNDVWINRHTDMCQADRHTYACMHKCIMVKIGRRKKRVNWTKRGGNVKSRELRFSEIGEKCINNAKIGGSYKFRVNDWKRSSENFGG